MRISHKLPLAAVLVTLFAISAATAVNLYIQRKNLFEQTNQKLEAISDGRRNEAKIYLESIKLDMLSRAASPSTTQALYGFMTTWPKLGDDPTGALQKRYIDDNPNPSGEKHKLDSARVDSYDRAHAAYHPALRAHLQAQGYYDIFLIDLDGNVVYTVFKERDFASNVIKGQWKDTELAKVYARAVALKAPGEVALTDFVSYEPSLGQPAAFMATPIWNKDRKLGILVIQLPNNKFNSLLGNEVGLGKTGQTLLVRKDGVIANDPVRTAGDDALKSQIDTTPFRDVLATGARSGLLRDSSGTMDQFAAVPLSLAGVDWYIVTVLSEEEAMSSVWSSALYTLLAAFIIVALAMAAAMTFSRAITRPITALVKAMASLANGDTTIALVGESRKDELGEMVRSVAVFRQAAIDKVALERQSAANLALLDQEREANDQKKAIEQVELKRAIEQLGRGLMRLSAGDLTIRIDTVLGQGLDQLRMNFNTSLQNLANTMEQVKANAHAMTDRVRDVTASAGELAHRTSQQAASLTQTSTALDQIMVATRLSSSRAGEASQMAQEAKKNSDSSSTVVVAAIEAMERIKAGSGEISQIINVIDEIAFQTNLLALNAGVEAARAGEAGKGFAVVAQEVRELAQRSANAAKDIKNLITRSGDDVSHGVALVEQTGAALTAIADHVTRINNGIQHIAEAAKEQAVSLAEVNRSMNLMEETTRANGQTADLTSENMTGLSADAEQLSGLVDGFVIENAIRTQRRSA